MTALRISYTILLLALIAVRFFWHRRAEILKPGIDNPSEGPFRIVRALLLPLWLIGMIGWPLDPSAFSWQEIPISMPARWAGVVLTGLGLALLAWVHVTLGRNFSPFLRIRADHTLVTDGPYRWVRHPMYTSFTAILIGFGLLTASGVLLVASALLLVAIAIRTRREEAMLLAHFGEAYEARRRRTGALTPWF